MSVGARARSIDSPIFIISNTLLREPTCELLSGESKDYVKTQDSNSLLANIRINVDEIYEVRHWAIQLGVSIQQLRAAIEHVGPLVGAVSKHLKDGMRPDNL